MIFLSGFLIGLALGVFVVSLLLYMLWQFSAPVNKWPAPGVGHGAVEMTGNVIHGDFSGGIDYRFLGATGEEQ